MINPEKLTFKRFITTVGNLPSSYVESLSYYECIMWLCNYLENTVIPAVNNNAEALEELQGLFVELQEYVDNYFENLDVQEEINNKLDSLVEDGTLTELIGAYCDPLINELQEQINTFEGNVNEQLQTQDTNIEVLSDRMDTFTHLTDGSTSGDAELADIRIGFNGITYDSAGNSVRTQANQVNQIKTVGYPVLYDLKSITWVEDKYIANNGNISDAVGFKMTNPIRIKGKKLLFDYKYTFGSSLQHTFFFNFYSSNDIRGTNRIGYANPSNAVASTTCYGNLLTVDVPDGTKYVVVSLITDNLSSLTIYDATLNTNIVSNNSIENTKIEDIIYKENLLDGIFVGGTIASDGTISGSSTYKISDYVPVTELTAYYRLNATNQALIGCYTSDKTWISRLMPNSNCFRTPQNCEYIRLCDSNADMVNQVFGKYEVDSFVPYNTIKTIDVSENEMFKSLNKLYNKKVCVMGDSIAYGVGATDRTTDSWVALLEKETGADIDNLAVSGASLQYRASVESIAKSVYTTSTETDFSDYDYVIISAGTNDILANVGTPESTSNTDACGALNLIIENILTSNPYCQIIFFGPMFRDRFSEGDGHNSDDYAWDGKWVVDLADVLQETAEKNHVPAKNLYKTFELNKYNADELLADGLHPNNLGHARLESYINSFINSNI